MDAPEKDWRYEALRYYRGRSFAFRTWVAPSSQWDHDHCLACSARFSDYDHPDVLRRGYVTLDPSGPADAPEPELIQQALAAGCRVVKQPSVNGFDERWVCPKCFDDYKEALDLKVD